MGAIRLDEPGGKLMRNLIWLTVAVGLLVPNRHAIAADARDVIEQAIRASGGEYRMLRTQAMTRTAKGSVVFIDKENSFTTQLTVAFPDRLRDRIEIDGPKQRLILLRVLNRDKGWTTGTGVTVEMNKQELEELREELYAQWVATVVPLKDKEFTLTLLPESTVDSQPTAVVQVARPGHADIKLYFDKRSYWLAKMERQGREAGMSLHKEYLFSEPREWAGVRMPMKEVEFNNGKRAVELLIKSYEFLDRVADSTFAKP
jgi:hypothetical protein